MTMKYMGATTPATILSAAQGMTTEQAAAFLAAIGGDGATGGLRVVTTADTLLASDASKVLLIDAASDIELVLPNDLPSAFACRIIQVNSGKALFAEAAGATHESGPTAGKNATNGVNKPLDLLVLSNADEESAAYLITGDMGIIPTQVPVIVDPLAIISATEIEIDLTVSFGAATHLDILVQKSPHGAGTWTIVEDRETVVATTEPITFSATGLEAETEYDFRAIVHIGSDYSISGHSTIVSGTTEAVPAFILENGIVAYYAGEDLTDASGNGHTLTKIGTVGNVSAKIGNGFQASPFSPSNSIQVGGSPVALTDLSISGWLYWDGATKTALCGTDTVFNFSINNVWAAQWVVGCECNWAGPALFSAPISGAGWRYVTWTREGTTNKLYVNGELVDTQTAPHADYDLTSISLGQPGNGDTFAGIIDELSIHNRALTADEVASMYNANSGRTWPLDGV